MLGAIGLPELVIILIVALVILGGSGIATAGRALGSASSPSIPTGETVFAQAFDRIPARQYEVGSRPGAMAELLGLGIDGIRWSQVTVIVIGTVTAENASLFLEFSPDRLEPSLLLPTLLVPGFFVFAAITAVRSFQNSLAVALTCGALVALFATAVRVVSMQSPAGFATADVLSPAIYIVFVTSVLDILALQFAASGRHRWRRMAMGLAFTSLATTYVAIGLWTSEWVALIDSPFVVQTAVLSAAIRTAAFWFGQAAFGPRD